MTDASLKQAAVNKAFKLYSHLGFSNKGFHFLLNDQMTTNTYFELWKKHEDIMAIEKYYYYEQQL
jgi:hypothetical protein